MIRPLHILVYSDFGGGKSTFLATLPKPMLVIMWDPLGKETPYLKTGIVEAMEDVKGVLTQRVMSRKDPTKLLIQIEHYIDSDPRSGQAYARYLSRMARFDRDGEKDAWASVVCDSVTFMSIAARKHAQYVLNPTTKEPRQWHNSSTDTLEEQLMLRFGSLNCNVGVAAHIDDSKTNIHGDTIFVPNAPGRLRRNLGSAFGEAYRMLVARDEDDPKKVVRWLQTQGDDEWMASTQIGGLERFVPPHYKYLRAAMANEDT